jgi:hypothetical protein
MQNALLPSRLTKHNAQQDCNHNASDPDRAHRHLPAGASTSESCRDLPTHRLAHIDTDIQDAVTEEDIPPFDQIADETYAQRLHSRLSNAHAESSAVQLTEVVDQALENDAKTPPRCGDTQRPDTSGGVVGNEGYWQREKGIDDAGRVAADKAILRRAQTNRLGDLLSEIGQDEFVVLRKEVVDE